jgi:ribonuclease VapC
MVIDTSAIVAIALNEPEAGTFEQRIAESPVRLISAATVLEAAMVIETRLGEPGGVELDLWLLKAGVEIVAVDAEQADQARRAWRRFGKGRHPAGLNFGDCFSYALSALTQESLLFKGEDFSRTDIEAASRRAFHTRPPRSAKPL